MMPGESPTAAAAATACANCGTLQQNLNEYVAALISLKQKIMATDRLLTDYEQKSNELKRAERENSAFRQQVEQMLQKLSPLEKCKEELRSVKAELEEKKSSLKMYQDTHLEYVCVKEEMNKSDAMKKKLEAKVKKLEKATEKHNLDFKQLKTEKKILEKKLKKAQEKIESFPSENKKKEKIKLLLEELWLCIDSSTGKSHMDENDCYLANFHNNSRPREKIKAVQNSPKPKRARGERPSHCSSPETCTTQPSLTPLQIKWDSRPARDAGQMDNEAYIGEGAPFQGQSPGFARRTEPSTSSLDLCHMEVEEAAENLTEILEWVGSLPRLLSPIQFSPATIPDMLFGELSDSSDEEVDQDTQKIKNMPENSYQSTPATYTGSKKNPLEPLRTSDSSGIKNKSSDPCKSVGRPTVLLQNKSVLWPNKIGAKSKEGEKHLEENCECMERTPKITFHSTEMVAKSPADKTETENKTLVCDRMSVNCHQEQEKRVEPGHVLEVVTSSLERVVKESTDLIKDETKEELTGTVETSMSSFTEDDQCPPQKGGKPQETKEPVLATENKLVVGRCGPSNVIRAAVTRKGSRDIQAESDLGRAGLPNDHTAPEQNKTEGSGMWHNGGPEFTDQGMNFGCFDLPSETDHHTDQVQCEHAEVMVMQTAKEHAGASGAFIKLHWAEEAHSKEDGCHRASEDDVNGEAELDGADALSLKSRAVDEQEDSLACSSKVAQTRNECSIAPSHSKNEEGDKLKTEVENIASKDKMPGSNLEETPSSLVVTNGCPHVDKKDYCLLLQEEPGNVNSPVLPTQVSVVKDGWSQPEKLVQTNQAAPELESIASSVSKREPFEDPDDKLEHMLIIHNISNSIEALGVIMEDKCLNSERLGGGGADPLKITAMGTAGLITAVECEQGASSEIALERPVVFCLVTRNSPNNTASQETAKQNDDSISLQPRKLPVEDAEMECHVTNEARLEVNPNGSSAQSNQDTSQAENAYPKAGSPVGLTISSEPSTALLFGRNGPGYDATADGQFSDPSFIAPSTRVDHCNHREHLMGKEAAADHSEESRPKSLDFCTCGDQAEVEIKPAGEHSPSSGTQALFSVQGCCDIKNTRELFKAPSPNNASAAHVSTANQDITSNDKGLITSSIGKIGSPSKNCTVEHPIKDAVSEEMDKILSSVASSTEAEEAKITDDAITVLDVSASSSEEEYPLRKVNPAKQDSRFLAFKEELDTAQNSQAGAQDNMTVSSDIHEQMYLAEDASPNEQTHNGDSWVKEATAETMENSCASPHSSRKSSSAWDASATDEKEASEYVALTSRTNVDGRELASGKVSAWNLEVSGSILPPEAELSTADSTLSAKQERTSKIAQNHIGGSTTTSFKKECHAKKDGEMLAAVTGGNSLPMVPKTSRTEKQGAISPKSELLITSSKQTGAQHVHKPSDFINLSTKAGVEGSRGRPLSKITSHTGRRKSQQDSLAESVMANASILMKDLPKTLRKIRQEMGNPLPPLLPPLIATPPKTVQPVTPLMSPSSQFPWPSPLNELISPLRGTPVPPLMSPLSDKLKQKCMSPSEVLIGERTLSSPLQFCAATPKHALPVPGRLPPSAAGAAAQAVPQENSVKILDSMYPKLSARAITLNILKGNVQLTRPSSSEGIKVPLPIHPISGFKEIASSSTAFVKTGTTLFSEPLSFRVSETGKRRLTSPAMPKSAKRLRLDRDFLNSDLDTEELSIRDSGTSPHGLADEMACPSNGDAILAMGGSKLLLPTAEIDPNRAVTVVLEKMSESCIDLFPAIYRHVHAGSTSDIPILTEEEEEVIYEFGVAKKCLAEPVLHAILKKLKHQKTSLGTGHIQSLCRVYVGICRQLRDLEKARLFCYSLLKEGFPQPGKLILFIGNMWSEVFTSEGMVNKAIQLVARKRSRGQVLKCLKTVLNWEESEPADIGMMVSSLLMAIKLYPLMEFQASEQHGEDLKENMWEYVFAIDLLCSHQKWIWTHNHIISKELWPIMDKWIKNRKGSGNASSPSDVIVATVLRLIGRLSQIGLKEGFSSAVKNISSVIAAFLQHAKEKDVPWGVQLAAVYSLCELGPSSPSEILNAMRAWEAANRNSLPPAIASSITQVRDLLEQ
ncbi:little elongation complex subunit 1 isoform X2 [Paroedura picta]|uniref:little elongation complex subunit 1 isoform X2 n=1 Tax=Paroedura picta TaxID=143630 RepID=UPI004057B15E